MELDISTRCHMVGDLNQMRRPGGVVSRINASCPNGDGVEIGGGPVHALSTYYHSTVCHMLNSSILIASQELIIASQELII